MLVTNSRTEPRRRYLFESRVAPVTADELAQGLQGIRGKLEATLTLPQSYPPIDDGDYAAWKRIVNDCANPELKAAYEDSYGTAIRFLRNKGVDGASYRVHTVTIVG